MENGEGICIGSQPTLLGEITSSKDFCDLSSHVYSKSDLEETMNFKDHTICLQDEDDTCARFQQPQGDDGIFLLEETSFDNVVKTTERSVEGIHPSVGIEKSASQVALGIAYDLNDDLACCNLLNSLDSFLDKSHHETPDILTDKIVSEYSSKTDDEKVLNSKKRRRNSSKEKKDTTCDPHLPTDTSKPPRKRVRASTNCTTAHRVEDEEINAFRLSKRVLLKEAKHVSMKDIMLRSFTSLAPNEDGVGGSSSAESPGEWENSKGDSKFMADSLSLGSAAHLELNIAVENGSQGGVLNLDGSIGSNPASLGSTSPTALSSWSPTIADSITSRFIATAQMQKRQNVERLLPLELTYSQRSQRPKSILKGLPNPPNSLGAILEDSCLSTSWAGPGGALKPSSPRNFSDLDEELIIGANDDAECPQRPHPLSDSYPSNSAEGTLMSPEERTSGDYLAASRLPSYLGGRGASSGNPSKTTEGNDDDDDESSQVAIARAITRRHEIWRLKHREIKGQRLVEQDERCKAKKKLSTDPPRSHPAVLPAQLAKDTILHAFPDGLTGLSTSGFAAAEGHVERSADSLAGGTSGLASFPAARKINPTPSGNSQSIQHINLSVDDLTMIRRLNSFDHTATQRVVVFGSAKRK
ncbi:unnamed protein product [Phytomonas sp. Hart1]|nr:unnamed protein product [Phytomonas sp. Hart1]|eukprot:CCW69461.1 unnamed protein product [Phytomonas sp. isolate Hart1]